MCRLFVLCADDLLLESAERQLAKGGADGLARAEARFQEALRRNPASADRWCDLGEAWLKSGLTEKARTCFSRALDLGAESIQILWRAGDFYFRVKENKTAMQCMSRILAHDPKYDALVFDSYLRSGATILDTLNYGIPEGRRAAQSYFRYLLRSGELADVQRAWDWIASRSLADDRLAGQYVDFLLKKQKFEAAVEAWTRHLGDRRGEYQESDFLYNGDFEFEPSGSSFDWRVTELEGVDVERDSAVSCSGSSSLRIRFEGKENLSYSHISQMAVVKPGGYLFRAQVRTEGITTDQGVGFRISDAESRSRLDIRIENFVGTSGCEKVKERFLVPRQTTLIQIQVVRQSSWKFDDKISGTAWIDGVSLVRLTR